MSCLDWLSLQRVCNSWMLPWLFCCCCFWWKIVFFFLPPPFVCFLQQPIRPLLCRMPSVCLLITYCVSVTAFQSCVRPRAPTYRLKIVFSSRVAVEWEIWSESEGCGMRGRASGRMSESQGRWTKGPVLSAPADRPPECHSWFTFPRGAMLNGCTPLLLTPYFSLTHILNLALSTHSPSYVAAQTLAMFRTAYFAYS